MRIETTKETQLDIWVEKNKEKMDTFIKANPALGKELQEKWSEINRLIRNQGIHNAEKIIQESNEYLKSLGIGVHFNSYA